MENFVNSLDNCIENENWYGALFIALTIPDICGKIEYPNDNSSKNRYAQWFNQYVGNRYISNVGPRQNPIRHTFLSGNDCYALRCSLLHEGREEIGHQRAQEALQNFHFITPPKNGRIHMNQYNNTLQLQIDIFANDIISGVRTWLGDIHNDADKTAKISNMIAIRDVQDNTIPIIQFEK